MSAVLCVRSLENLEALRNATIDTCMLWAAAGRRITSAPKPKEGEDIPGILAKIGTASCNWYFALHPMGRLRSGGSPSCPADWKVVKWEILIRCTGGGDAFPFADFAMMNAQQRKQLTMACAGLSSFLDSNEITATCNVQRCDKRSLQAMMQEANIDSMHEEMAEFDEDENGKIGLPPKKARHLDESILDEYVETILDDCGEGDADAARSYARIALLVN